MPAVHRNLRMYGLAVALVLTAGTAWAAASPHALAATGTTAWQGGRFVVDTPNLVRRSDIVLGRPNADPTQFVPLGNGTLGVAAWAAGGFTAQLNRTDTFPDRKSPGQVAIPGLARLTGAADFSGYLDLYDGMLHESGGGMTMTAYVRADTAQLVVDVTGADPNSSQSAQVRLWSGRSPSASASGAVAALAETWVDNSGAGASGQTFGSLAAVTAGGRNVTAATPDSTTAQVAFQPNTDGSYRVIVAAPAWTGGDALGTASTVLNGDAGKPQSSLTAAHLSWWHTYWSGAGLIKVTSADGAGDYVENLRTLYLYDTAAESRGTLPGSQAGVADLFNFSQDHQDWFPAGYWFWNLRMQVQANLSAGRFALNDPVFRLYQSNVANISAWTGGHMPGRQGLCVPETMRFNGNGTYFGGTSNASCDSTITPTYNSLTITTGAEIGLWIWQQYQMTDDSAFLSANYPVLSGAARFLLSYAATGSDGLLHTQANAHETQWNVTDPVTDILAMQALFPVVVRAAQTLGVDAALVSQLNAAIPKIPPLPRTDTATKTQLLTAAADAGGADMIGWSTQPTAPWHNDENLGLEAVFPYNVIGDSSALTALARRTYTSRIWTNANDWSFDPLHAARLGLSTEVRSTLVNASTTYQSYPAGLASFTRSAAQEPYIEQAGVLAATVSEALAQDYDGLLRIAPAWPADWSGEGTVYIQHNSTVSVQVQNGSPVTVAIMSGSNSPISVRSPWPGQSVTVVDGSGATVLGAQSNATFTIPAQAGRAYLVELTASPTTGLPFAAVSGTPAGAARHLGAVSIGLDRSSGATSVISLRAHANGRYVTADNAGAQPLIANRTAIGGWEQFDVLDAGGGDIALRAHANNQIVSAANAGAAPLIANRTAIGSWETFQLIHNPDGSVTLKALVNNQYVTADNAGNNPLIANRTAIGPWEEFDLINN
ncbi:MAG: alpha-L-fucosidase 2 [Micromonosporaceae bacterium]